MPRFARRQLIQAGLAVPALSTLTTRTRGAANASSGRFIHGVASGDPASDSVLIWTRVEPVGNGLELVGWEIADDPAFEKVVQNGSFSTDEHRDFTVKVVATDLKPGRVYYYRFSIDGESSRIGRTRTLPDGHIDALGLAIASCSNFAFGYFNAYDAIAADASVQFVLHLGDYIYEYGADGWGSEVAQSIGRVHEPANEIVSLQDYRERHAQYKRDPGSQRMHAMHPLMLVWDDHESTNNPWLGGAQNHQPESEGDWRDRRFASIRAYYEWMPIRDPQPGACRAQLWRNYVLGDLATLTTLESRHTARARQIDYADHAQNIQTMADARRFEQQVLGAPNREMLSVQMKAFLAEALRESVGADIPWRLIGNAIPMARMPVPDVAGLGIVNADPGGDGVPGADSVLTWKGRYGLPFYLDTWDGYPVAREEFYELCSNAGARDLVVLTGDSHSFWANQLYSNDGTSMGVEIGTAGISSPGDFVETGFDRLTAQRLDEAFAEHVEEVRWTDNLHQGYVRLNLTHDHIEVTYVGVSTVLQPDYVALDVREERIHRRGAHLGYS